MKKFLMIFLTACMAISCMIVPSFAADYPVPLEAADGQFVFVEYYPSLVEKQYRLYKWSGGSESTRSVLAAYDGTTSDYYLSVNGFTSYALYYAEEGDTEWTYWSSHDSSGAGYFFDNVVYTSEPIYSSEGELFFPVVPTLGETVEALTAEQSKTVQNQTVGVMKILVPCGVGCLALLMALPTLRKGFLRFLH